MSRILIIEDQLEIAQNWVEMFSQEGYAVDCAYDGATALNIIRTNHPDIILSDISMPGLSGFQIKEILIARGDCTPVIFISGQNMPENISRSRQLGAVSFLSKPIPLKDLRAVVKRVIAYGRILNGVDKAIAKIIVRGDFYQERLLGENLTIGREKKADLVILDRRISAIHLTLVRIYECNNSFYRVIDGRLGFKPSSNGIQLNYKRIEAYADLKNGDILSLPNNLEIEYIDLRTTDDAREKTYTGEDDT